MAILRPVIVPAKVLKGGKHKIRIAVAHNGETRYIVTNIIIDKQTQFDGGVIVRRGDAAYLNTKLRSIIQKYQDALDELPFAEALTCAELLSTLKTHGKDKYITVESLFEECLLNSQCKESTKKINKTLWKIIKRNIDTNILASHVTHNTVLTLDRKLRAENLKDSSINVIITQFAKVINYGIRCGYISFKVNPFKGYKKPYSRVRESWLTVEQIKTIRDCNIKNARVRKARDIFMLSYYLGGINMVDLIKINFNQSKNYLKYKRTKTDAIHKVNEYVEFEIPQEAKEIIQNLIDESGRIALTDSQRKYVCNHFFRCNFNKLEELTGIEKIIYYSARKSFCQHAFDLGIQTSVIDYIIGHKLGGGGTSLYSYIAVKPQMATDAIRKVLDNLKK